MARCRCGHTQDVHTHYHAAAYCGVCGPEKCPRFRRLWLPRDAENRGLREGDRVRLAGGTNVGHVARIISNTEALIDWGQEFSITKCVNLLLQPRDQGSI